MSDDVPPQPPAAVPPTTPPPPAAAAPSLPATQRTPASAICSLALGVLTFLCFGGILTAIPAIVCGHVARSAIRKSGGTLSGKGVATAGLALGYVGFVLFFILSTVFLVGMIRGEKAEAAMRAHATQEVAAIDGHSRVTIPRDWRELSSLNDKASLQVGNKVHEQYLIVLTEAKADLADMTLQKHHQLTRDSMLKKMTDSSATDPVEVSISGDPALQDELSGTQNGTRIVFLHTTVDDGEYFHQILAWTTKSRWPQAKEQLQKVTETFRGAKSE